MVVKDLGGRHDVTSDAQIEALLATRNEQGLNEFWLRHGGQIYPALLIQAKRSSRSRALFSRRGTSRIPIGGPCPRFTL
jgi:hypothetical protein